MVSAREPAAVVAEAYYDSDDADEFYFRVWGGEDIHIGIYATEYERISRASRRTVAEMACRLGGLSENTRVLDLGSGYGGAARYLAEAYGCKVTCLNLSETQNERNRARVAEEGLGHLIDVVHGNFEHIPLPSHSYDVVWSQDALLHSADRGRVLAEARRMLRPGGHLTFTDPVQSDDCPAGALQAVYDRIHLESLASYKFYRQALWELGFVRVECVDLSKHLVRHYARVRQELSRRYEEMASRSSRQYVDDMLVGLSHWVQAGQRGHLRWGIITGRGG
jgi:sarcosine/dimethylglycine N-methyltransferase